MAPVMRIVTAVLRIAGSGAGNPSAVSHITAAPLAPTIKPIAGKYRTAPVSCPGACPTHAGTRMRVKYCTAVSSRRISFTLAVGDACGFEARHLGHESRCRFDQRPRQRSARSFAEPQAQVEQRLGLQILEQLAMPGLRRAMTEDAVRAHACVHFRRQQRRDAHSEAVDDHDAAM